MRCLQKEIVLNVAFSCRYLIQNQEWLKAQLCGGEDDEVEGDPDDDYILFDMPGQIELYTHLQAGRDLVNLLQSWNFRICSVFLIDSQFMIDGPKFLSGTMAALSVMANMELPHVNILSKMDLLSKTSRAHLDKYVKYPLCELINIPIIYSRYLEPDPHSLLGDVVNDTPWGRKYHKLSEAIGNLIEDFSLVRFTPLNLNDEENISDLLLTIDNVIQYGEDSDTKTKDFEQPDPEDNDNEDTNYSNYS